MEAPKSKPFPQWESGLDGVGTGRADAGLSRG